MKKAVFIIPYFGKLPNYFPIWSKTAKANKEYDFWVITDDNTAKSVSENIKIVSITFAEFVEKVQEKFSFQLGLKTPRKLCDFKPTYGYIFEDEIKEYLYWGYCDVDIVLGNLSRFIPIDAGFDKLFVHGHMTLFKNNYKMNRLFMNQIGFPESYVEILSDTENRMFDEASDGLNINLIAHISKINTYIDYNIADINPYTFLFKRSLYDYSLPSKINRRVRTENIIKQIFYWNDGKLYRYAINNVNDLVVDEFRYFHFQKRSMLLRNIAECNSFLVVPNMIIPFVGEITKDLVEKYTKDKIIYLQYFRLKWRNLKKKLGR